MTLAIIIPSRGRPASVARTVEAWKRTGAFEVARLVYALNEADALLPEYLTSIGEAQRSLGDRVERVAIGDCKMVPRLNQVARLLVAPANDIRALGFQGDDHVPRTEGWAHRYLAELDELVDAYGSGMVHGDDGVHGRKLCTEWAVSRSWVETLGRMVPALVQHLYCDDAVHDLAKAAGVYRYLGDDITIEHMHPLHGKGQRDATYAAGGLNDSIKHDDRRQYLKWSMRPRQVDKLGLSRQAAMLRALRPAEPAVES